MRVLGASLLLLAFICSSVQAQETLPQQKKGGGSPKSGTSNPASTKSGGNPASTKSGGNPASTKSGGNPASTKSGGSNNSAPPNDGSGAGSAKSKGSAESRTKEPNNPAPPTNSKNANSGKGAAATPKALTEKIKDQVSYAIGRDLGERFKAEGDDVNFQMILKGLSDAHAGKDPVFTMEQMQAAMQVFQVHMQQKAEEQLRNFAAENIAFLDANKKKAGIKTTKSGLQYQVLKSGTGKTPKSTDWIRANYHGTLIDGSVFETTTEEGGEPVEIAVEETIPGWTEALGLMKVGDKWRLFIPASLAYGEMGQPPVPPHATLIFELELIEIVKPPKNSAGEKEAKSNLNLK